MNFIYFLLLLFMPLTHIEHPEDTILTGDLSALDCMGSSGNLSAKIDGSPAVVWGNDPKDGRFFVGTKSVFNKRNPKLMKSYDDIDANYNGELNEILTACFRWLPSRDKSIYQGDFIGFGGSNTWTPNTLTYTLPTVADEQIVIAPHTEYYENRPYPLHNNLSDRNGYVKFIRPEVAEGDLCELNNYIKFARIVAKGVDFLTSEREVAELKKELNAYIREGREINPKEWENSKIVFLWKLVQSLKEDYMDTCETFGELETTLNGEQHEGEGYVKFNEYGHIKLVRRRSFSHANFNNPRFVRS